MERIVAHIIEPNGDATEVSVEVLEHQVDELVKAELTRLNITDARIAELNTEVNTLVSVPITSKEQYALVKGVRAKAENLNSIVKQVCEAARKPAILEQRAWVAKQKELQGPIQAARQRALDHQIAWEDKLRVEALEADERKKAQERERLLAIEGLGFVLKLGTLEQGECFELNGTMIPKHDILSANGEVWANLLRSATTVSEEFRSAQFEAERVRKEAEDRQAAADRELKEREEKLHRDQQELERKQKEMRDAVNIIRKKGLMDRGMLLVDPDTLGIGDMRVIISGLHTIDDHAFEDLCVQAMSAKEHADEAARTKAEQERKKAEADRLAEESRQQSVQIGSDRAAELIALGAERNGVTYVLGNEVVMRLKLLGAESDDLDWGVILNRFKAERIRLDAATQEQKRQEAAASEALKTDAEKYRTYINGLLDVAIPEFSSPQVAHAVKDLRKYIVERGGAKF